MPDGRAIAIDAVVDGEVLLVEGDHEPYENEWVLPGGIVERGATTRQSCVPEPRGEASSVETLPVADLPRMGFDHREIVADAF